MSDLRRHVTKSKFLKHFGTEFNWLKSVLDKFMLDLRWPSHEIKIWLLLNNILYKVMDSCYFTTELAPPFFTFVESLCWPSHYDFLLGGISKYHVIGTYHSRLWFEDTGTVKPEINAGSCLPSNLYLYCTTCNNCHSQKNHLSVKVNFEALFLAFTVVCRTPFLSLAQCHYLSEVLVYVYLLIL